MATDPPAQPGGGASSTAPSSAGDAVSLEGLSGAALRSQLERSAQKSPSDLTGDSIEQKKEDSRWVPLGEGAYSPDRARDRTRETITLWLLGIFCVLIALSFTALFVVGLRTNFNEGFYTSLKGIVDVLVGPVVSLLSSAIGFYFGYQSATAQQKTAQDPPRPVGK